MQIIAVSNMKGGVGKTTTSVNLAFLAAESGSATVLWDLDPQGAATYTLRGTPDARAKVKHLVKGKVELPELVAQTDYPRLDLLPADFSYRNFDVHLRSRKHSTERLLRMSRALDESYDYLFLDCPPGMSLLTENVLRAAEVIVVPVLPTPLSLRMLEQLLAFVEHSGWPDMKVLPFFSMVDRRKALHAQVIAATRDRIPSMLATEIPYWSDIERMTVRRAPLPAYAPGSPAALLYRGLWNEIGSHLAT